MRLLVVHVLLIGGRRQQSSSSGHGLSVVHAGWLCAFSGHTPSGGGAPFSGSHTLGRWKSSAKFLVRCLCAFKWYTQVLVVVMAYQWSMGCRGMPFSGTH